MQNNNVTEANTVIKTVGLTKIYGMNTAVNNVSLTVREGDIYGFIGSNGAGKTTFIRMLMGLITPNSGSLELFGESNPAILTKSRAKVGCIVETPSLMLNMTAYDCLNTQRLLYGIQNKQIIDELLVLVGLHDTGKKRVANFSLGMKQRLSIAQALLNEPKILVLDEPTNGMDPQGIVEMRQFLKKLRDERGVTILISSHILTELQQLATRFGIIERGVLIDEFSAEEFKKSIELNLIINVSDADKATKLIQAKLPQIQFLVDMAGGNLKLSDQSFYDVARLLVQNDIEFAIVDKLQANLESYFISKVGAQHA